MMYVAVHKIRAPGAGAETTAASRAENRESKDDTISSVLLIRIRAEKSPDLVAESSAKLVIDTRPP